DTLVTDAEAGWEKYGTHSDATINVGAGAYWTICYYQDTFFYDYFTWAEIQAIFAGATVVSVGVDLSWPQDASGGVVSTVYVDDITINDTIYYGKIQDAIDTVTALDTISVAAGVYSENVVVNKSLTLNGANVGINAVTGTRGSESIIDADGNAVRIGTDESPNVNVTFQGFTVQGWTTNGVSQKPFATGIAKILDNIVIGPAETSEAGNSICVFGSSSEVKGNKVDGTLCGVEGWEGAGIMVVNGSNVVIKSNWVYSADTA
ncbi:unnamed protein product, partial [marine sediment metagenome]